MQKCQNSCPKVQRKTGTSAGSSFTEVTKGPSDGPKDTRKTAITDRKSPQQSQKSVYIVEADVVVDAAESRTVREIEEPILGGGSRERNLPRERKESPRSIQPPKNEYRMSGRAKTSPKGGENSGNEWNSAGHNPCSSSCPITKARDRGIRKAELRQQRLDHYLLNKGFRYFDDLCTCSSICLMYQLKRDKFVREVLKSACLFTLGMKLCVELDAWNIIG